MTDSLSPTTVIVIVVLAVGFFTIGCELAWLTTKVYVALQSWKKRRGGK